MAFVGDLVSGNKGMGYTANQDAHLQTPVTNGKFLNTYQTAQNQISYLNQLKQQLGTQQALQHQSDVYGQLQGIAAGTGPNPAQAMLANTTGNNVANQSALMASQRGAGANVGLIARQAAMQGANTQQQATGQAALMQAEQSMNAINQAGSMANTQAGQLQQNANSITQAAQNQENAMLQGIGAQNNARVGQLQSSNSANAGVQGQIASGQANLLSGITGGAGAALAAAHGGMVPHYAEGEMVEGAAAVPYTADPINSLDKALSPSNAPKSSFGKFVQGFNGASSPDTVAKSMNSAGQGLGKGLVALGKYAMSPSQPQGQSVAGGPMDTMMNNPASMLLAPVQTMTTAPALEGVSALAPMLAAHGGQVPAVVSPGETYLSPKDVSQVQQTGKNPLNVGKKIPGQPNVPGDSYANDTVPVTLQEGGIVIPNSVMQSKDPGKKAAAFVEAVLAKHGKKLPARK